MSRSFRNGWMRLRRRTDTGRELLLRALEYGIPKTSRMELVGEIANTEVQIHRVQFVYGDGTCQRGLAPSIAKRFPRRVPEFRGRAGRTAVGQRPGQGPTSGRAPHSGRLRIRVRTGAHRSPKAESLSLQ